MITAAVSEPGGWLLRLLQTCTCLYIIVTAVATHHHRQHEDTQCGEEFHFVDLFRMQRMRAREPLAAE
ncbi:hypothetical protein JYU34_006247 [Plutella xylostella]|uniref:Secreted protein n=1 Tax=Plutella xylostella TaxID=51655 RepID=A0ABQ7QRJ2_PLUXY|nr:hypothetical protein JYU34_006247 [Plutella xylostella]